MKHKNGLALLVPLICLSMAVAAAGKAPELARTNFRDLQGHKQSLAAYQGKILVLNFWATWCGPCRQELPMLDDLARQYSERGVAFLAVSLDEKSKWKSVPDYLQEHKVTLPVMLGADAGTLSKFHLGIEIPATIIFDSDGQPVARILGEARRDEIVTRLDWLLGGRKGTAPAPVVKHL